MDKIDDLISQGESWVLKLHDTLYQEGLLATAKYHALLKQTNFGKEESAIYPRVRKRPNGTPSFYWERLIKKYHPASLTSKIQTACGPGKSYLSYVRDKNGNSRRVKVCLLSKHIPINTKTKRISLSAFKGQPLWSQIAGEASERELCSLRKQEAAVSRISRNLSILKALREKK